MAILQILEVQILELGASTQKISKFAVQGIIDLVLVRQVKLKCIIQKIIPKLGHTIEFWDGIRLFPMSCLLMISSERIVISLD